MKSILTSMAGAVLVFTVLITFGLAGEARAANEKCRYGYEYDEQKGKCVRDDAY